jgi:hypothetical protein
MKQNLKFSRGDVVLIVALKVPKSLFDLCKQSQPIQGYSIATSRGAMVLDNHSMLWHKPRNSHSPFFLWSSSLLLPTLFFHWQGDFSSKVSLYSLRSSLSFPPLFQPTCTLLPYSPSFYLPFPLLRTVVLLVLHLVPKQRVILVIPQHASFQIAIALAQAHQVASVP